MMESLKFLWLPGVENNEQVSVRDDLVFTPKKNGRTSGVLNVGPCNIQLTVAWSLFKNYNLTNVAMLMIAQ